MISRHYIFLNNIHIQNINRYSLHYYRNNQHRRYWNNINFDSCFEYLSGVHIVELSDKIARYLFGINRQLVSWATYISRGTSVRHEAIVRAAFLKIAVTCRLACWETREDDDEARSRNGAIVPRSERGEIHTRIEVTRGEGTNWHLRNKNTRNTATYDDESWDVAVERKILLRNYYTRRVSFGC